MIDAKLIGSRIRELRHKNNLTQSEFANILSVSFQAVSNWERGIAPPDVENLVRIASYFGVMVDALLAPASEDLYLGVDGGGTKTVFVVVSASGQVLCRKVAHGSNPNDVGFSVTEELITSHINEILREFPSLTSVFCGIAGMATGNYAEKLGSVLKKLYPHLKIQIASDALNLFSLCDEADMVVISGTGSVVFVRSGDGYDRIGGWGYLFDTAGSAYDIGRSAIQQALAEEDLLLPPSLMSKLLYEKMNSESAWAHVNTLYSKGKPYIASFASVVFDAYREGDENAARIIDENAAALAKLLNIGVELHGANKLAVASGGLFEHFSDVMNKHISKYTDVALKFSDLPPIFGACRKACAIGGAQMSDDFYQNFKISYGEMKK